MMTLSFLITSAARRDQLERYQTCWITSVLGAPYNDYSDRHI